MPGTLTSQDLLELARLRRRLRQLEEDLGLQTTSPKSPLMSRFGVDGDIEKLIGENPTSFVSIHAADGNYLFASAGCESLFGWSPSQLVGESAYVFFHEDDLARIADDHASHSSKHGEHEIGYRLRCADGTYREVTTRSQAVVGDNGIEQIVCVTRPRGSR